MSGDCWCLLSGDSAEIPLPGAGRWTAGQVGSRHSVESEGPRARAVGGQRVGQPASRLGRPGSPVRLGCKLLLTDSLPFFTGEMSPFSAVREWVCGGHRGE